MSAANANRGALRDSLTLRVASAGLVAASALDQTVQTVQTVRREKRRAETMTAGTARVRMSSRCSTMRAAPDRRDEA